MIFNRKRSWHYIAGFYVVVVTILSLYPRVDPPPIPVPTEISSGLLPEEGDNFKVINDVVVYYLERGQRRSYKTGASYLQRSGNPPFGTPYEEGGILLVDSFVLLLHPLGADMPRLKDTTSVLLAPTIAQGPAWWEPYTHWDKLGHAGVYLLLGLLLWKSCEQRQQRSFITAVWVLLSGTVIGWTLEWAQATWALGRDAEWGDLLMNTLGLILGIGIGWGWQRWTTREGPATA